MTIDSILNFGNYAFVLFFGVWASLAFADFPFRQHTRFYLLTLLGFGGIQIAAYLILGEALLYKCYPLLIHLPLILLIYFVLHRNIYISVNAVFSAYLLCTPRKWLGTFVAFFFDNDPRVSNLVTILVTIPLLLLVEYYITPHIIKLKYEQKRTLLLFFLLPLSYYIIEYALTVYTDLLYSGGAFVVEFMDSFIVLLYFILSMLSLEFSNQKNQAERENILLTTAAQQAEKQIAQLSDSQKQASIYRHDLRHHMNFLQSCIAKGNTEEALEYIQEICTDLESTRVIRYCDNDAVNLILSSYAEKAAALQVKITIHATATDFSRFQITDLCSLLSNALENALHACEQVAPVGKRYITLQLYDKNNLLCINMANSYHTAPVFEDEIPISRKEGHGIGVRSMISVIEKYHGLYGFFADHGEFRFQACL